MPKEMMQKEYSDFYDNQRITTPIKTRDINTPRWNGNLDQHIT